jgi:methyl-accepting chemotaxis protein
MTQPDFAIGIQYELRQLAKTKTELSEKIVHLMSQMDERLDRLTEVVTTGFDELKQITQQQADTARMQAESVDRLVALLERREGG